MIIDHMSYHMSSVNITPPISVMARLMISRSDGRWVIGSALKRARNVDPRLLPGRDVEQAGLATDMLRQSQEDHAERLVAREAVVARVDAHFVVGATRRLGVEADNRPTEPRRSDPEGRIQILDEPEVEQRDSRPLGQNEQIARMRVGVEEALHHDLLEVGLEKELADLLDVEARRLQLVDSVTLMPWMNSITRMRFVVCCQ